MTSWSLEFLVCWLIFNSPKIFVTKIYIIPGRFVVNIWTFIPLLITFYSETAANSSTISYESPMHQVNDIAEPF